MFITLGLLDRVQSSPDDGLLRHRCAAPFATWPNKDRHYHETINSEINSLNGKMATDFISYGYAAVVLAGGVIGYVKVGECCWMSRVE